MGRFDDWKCRCSSIGKIMTEGRGSGITEKQLETIAEYQAKAKLTDKQAQELARLVAKRDAPPELSDTAKAHLIECYINEVYGRTKDVTTKYMEKGLKTEEDALTIVSRIKRIVFEKNEQRLENEFITGEPDAFIGTNIIGADHIIDTKACWDIFTFYKAKYDGFNSDYGWQLQGYTALSGAPTSSLCYCLTDTPSNLIEQEKRSLQFKMGVIDREANPDFIEACAQLEHNMTYADVPLRNRMVEYGIERSEELITSIYDRVKMCRVFLNELYEKEHLMIAA